MRVRKRIIGEDRKKWLERIGVDKEVYDLLSKKMELHFFEIKDAPPAVGNIIKQTALSCGTDAAVHRDVITGKKEKSSVILFGTCRELEKVAESLKNQPFGLGRIAEDILKLLKRKPATVWKIREGEINLEKPVIMGILNVTPDSFSDGGRFFEKERAVEHGLRMVEEGAEIVDVGGESTRPGAEPVPEKEELRRIIPVIQELAEKNIVVSVDTYKAKVAEEALEAGARIVNDVSALRFDERMGDVVKKYGAGLVLMHMKGTPRDMQKNPYYEDCMDEIYTFLEERIEYTRERGVEQEKIVVDPGIGFGKRQVDNLTILKNLSELSPLGRPILIGPSRKSFIGNILNLPPEERIEGTLASLGWAYLGGARIFRVHDVREAKRFLSVFDEIGRSSWLSP